MPDLTNRLTDSLRLVADDLQGGYETEAELAAFKHGMQTMIRALTCMTESPAVAKSFGVPFVNVEPVDPPTDDLGDAAYLRAFAHGYPPGDGSVIRLLGEIANRVEAGDKPELNDPYFLHGLGSSAGDSRLISIADVLGGTARAGL